jgi:hypothetical protein
MRQPRRTYSGRHAPERLIQRAHVWGQTRLS